MDFLKEAKELASLVKGYLKKSKMKNNDLALLLRKDPAYISRLLNGKHDVSVETMLTILKSLGYEVAVLTKKEKNLLERGAYEELAKNMPSIREEIRKGVITEIESDLVRDLTNLIHDKINSSNKVLP